MKAPHVTAAILSRSRLVGALTSYEEKAAELEMSNLEP